MLPEIGAAVRRGVSVRRPTRNWSARLHRLRRGEMPARARFRAARPRATRPAVGSPRRKSAAIRSITAAQSPGATFAWMPTSPSTTSLRRRGATKISTPLRARVCETPSRLNCALGRGAGVAPEPGAGDRDADLAGGAQLGGTDRLLDRVDVDAVRETLSPPSPSSRRASAARAAAAARKSTAAAAAPAAAATAPAAAAAAGSDEQQRPRMPPRPGRTRR